MAQAMEKIDALIKSGALGQARRLLNEARRSGAVKTERLGYARLSRRLDMPMVGLRILHPLIHSPTQTPSEEVRCEYAAALSQVGAYWEAETLLESISDLPQALLFRAFNCITQWNYPQAAELLRRYVLADGMSEYERLIGQANLAAALIYDNSPEAELLLNDLMAQTRGTNYHRLQGHLLLLKGEYEVGRENWGAAFESLSESFRRAEKNTMDRFLVKKWSTFASLYSNRDRLPLTLMELNDLREEATRLGEWETVRSVDYHLAKATGNPDLAGRVYFGTPFPIFRKRVLQYHPELVHRSSYLWMSGEGDTQSIYDIAQGFESPFLKCGQVAHRLLLVLSRDFYRPMKIAEIHSRLFPGDHFNVESSPLRVRKAVERAKRGISEAGIALRIQVVNGHYSLEPQSGTAFRVSLDRECIGPEEELRRCFPRGQLFTASHAGQVVGLSAAQGVRLVYRLHEEGALRRKFRGKRTRYYFSEAA